MEPDYLLYSKVSLHWTPVRNGAETPHIKYSLQGGLGVVAVTFWEPPSLAGVSGAAPLKLRIDVKFPCKSTVISSQSGAFIRQRYDGRSYV